MKKILLAILPTLLFSAAVYGQGPQEISVTGIELARVEDQSSLTFTLQAGRKTTKNDHNLVVNPVIRNGAFEMQLPSIVVQGRRAKVSEQRHRLATGGYRPDYHPTYTQNGGTVQYRVMFPYEEWMRGANLYLNGVSVGCCSATEAEIGLIAEQLFQAETRTEIEVTAVPVVIPAASTGDRLAAQYPFIAPIAAFEKAREIPEGVFDYNMALNLGKGLTSPKQNEVESFINNTREGSISIYFRQGRNEIDRNYMDNNRLLVELISAVRTLAASDDSKIARIVIAGFASPEGSLAVNERLAWDRAVAVKSFLTGNSGIDPQIISIYNGSVDWIGLREMVAKSDMFQKFRIIDIIDNTPVWDSGSNTGRHGKLMQLDSGEPYRYMLQHFFPQLRQAAYIKVYYEPK